MPTPMRFRTDGSFFDPDEPAGKPAPKPGDTWLIRWYRPGGAEGPIAGYAICCPGCRKVHDWTTATNCKPCSHQGISSCWTWTGSAEANVLTASPSLHSVKDLGGCGWHGHLINGVLTP